MSPEPQTGIAYVLLAGTSGCQPAFAQARLEACGRERGDRYRVVRLGGFPHRARRSGGKLDCGRCIVLSQA